MPRFTAENSRSGCYIKETDIALDITVDENDDIDALIGWRL